MTDLTFLGVHRFSLRARSRLFLDVPDEWSYCLDHEIEILVPRPLDNAMDDDVRAFWETQCDYEATAGLIMIDTIDLWRARRDGFTVSDVIDSCGADYGDLMLRLLEDDTLAYREDAQRLFANDPMSNPSLAVVAAVAILPRFRHHRLGLAATASLSFWRLATAALP